jgi:hypothetical protein
MSQRNLTSVLLKVLGVVSIIKAVDFAANLLMMLFQMFGMHGDWSGSGVLRAFLPTLAPLVIYLLTAFILIRYAGAIAARLFPAEASAFPDDSAPSDRWYVLAFTVLGVILVVWYVPMHIATCLGNVMWIADDPPEQFEAEIWRSIWDALLRGALHLGLGLYLILGSKRIVAIIRKVRPQ